MRSTSEPARLARATERVGRGLYQRVRGRFRAKGSYLWFTLVLRAAYLAEVAIRPVARTEQIDPAYLGLWWGVVVAFALYLAGLTVIFVASNERHPYFASVECKRAQIALDLIFFGLFYLLNGDPESNLVLAFWLPLAIAARHFRPQTVALVFVAVIAWIGAMVVWLNRDTPAEIFAVPNLRLFGLRSALFLVITWPLVRSELLVRQLRQQSADYRRRIENLARQVRDAQGHAPDELIAGVLNAARKELSAEVVSLFLYHDGVFRRYSSSGLEPRWFADEAYAAGTGLTGQVAASIDGTDFGHPVRENAVLTSAQALPEYLARYAGRLTSGGVRHLAAVPLDGANRTFGILRALNKRGSDGTIDPAGFNDGDQDVLSSTAVLLSLAYAAHRREHKTRVVLSVADVATSGGNELDVCGRIAELGLALGYPVCCVRLRDVGGSLGRVAVRGIEAGSVALFESLATPLAEHLEVLQSGATRTIDTVQEDARCALAVWGRALGLASAIILPLRRDQQIVGVLEVYTHACHRFFDDERATLEMFAAKAAGAMERARLAEQSEDQIRRLRILTDAINAITSSPDKATLFDRVAHKVAALVDAEDCSVFIVNRRRQSVDLTASHRVPQSLFQQRAAPISSAPRAGLPSYVAATGKALRFVGEEFKAHPSWSGAYLEHLAYLPSKRCASLLLVPIVDSSQQVLGIIRVENKQGSGVQYGFTDEDHGLLELLTTQIAVALVTIDQVLRLKHLVEVARGITEMGEPRAVLTRIAASAGEFAQADVVMICPYDGDQGRLLVDDVVTLGQHTPARMKPLPRASGLTHDVLTTANGCVVVEDLALERERQSEFAEQERIRSLIAVALKVRSKPVGILYINFRQPRRFAPEEISNARAFGELAAVALANANLLKRERQTVEELSAVQQLTGVALKRAELDSMLESVVQTICSMFGFELCTVSLVNEAARMIETRKGIGVSRSWIDQARHSLRSNDIQAVVVGTAESIVVTGYDQRLDPDMYERFGQERLTRVFMPIGERGRVIGTLEAGYYRSTKPEIEPAEIERLQHYLRPVALAIENAQLLEQAHRRATQLQRLHDVSQQIDRTLTERTLDEVLRLAVEALPEILGHRTAAAIHLSGPQAGPLDLKCCGGVDAAGLASHPLFAREDHVAVFLRAEARLVGGRYDWESGQPFACVPLKIGGQCFGTLSVISWDDHWFAEDNVKMIDLCAAQIASAIATTREQERLNRQLEDLADDIKQSYHTAIGHPLINIAGVLDNMLDERAPLGPLTARQSSTLRTARENLHHLRQQIRRLLLARRIEEDALALQCSPVLIGEIVLEAVRKVEPMFLSKGVALQCDLRRADATLSMDRERIHEVLADVLTNAYKFSQAGGTVSVCVIADAHEVRVDVVDTGRGIAAEDHDKVFEKFVQLTPLLKSRESGAGLGLYLAKRLVEAHGGAIRLASELGIGSTFSLVFPRTDAQGGDDDGHKRRTANRDDRRRR